MASVFSPAYKVPDKLVAETQALRKKTTSIRGTGGVRRNNLIEQLSMQKYKSTNRLTYMDPPAPRPQAEAGPPLAAEAGPPMAVEAGPQLVIPPVTYPSSEDEVLVVLLSPWPTLTQVLNRPWQAQLPLQSYRGPGPNARPSSALNPAVSRLRPSVKGNVRVSRHVLPACLALPARRFVPSPCVMTPKMTS